MANIRTARRSGLVLRGGRQRRESLWTDLAPAALTMSASGGTISHTPNAALLALRPFTVVRSRGAMYLRSDQSAAVEFQTAAWGGCVVSDEALAIGVTAVPTPVTELASDLWFIHQFIMGGENNVAGALRSLVAL